MSTEHNPDNLTPEQVGEGWRLLKRDAANAELSRLRDEIERIKKEESERFEHIREALTAERAEVERVKAENEKLNQHVKDVFIINEAQLAAIQDLRAQLSTERAAREQAEKRAEYVQGLQAEITKAFPSARLASSLKVAIAFAAQEKDAFERERDSLAERLAESESREHQLREALDIARKTIADFEDDIPLLDSECVEHIREAVNAIESALTALTSTTVADLRLKLETAERERDAVVKVLTELVRSVSDVQDWSGTRTGDALDIAEAAIATTQETK